jgi:hypothetical protein
MPQKPLPSAPTELDRFLYRCGDALLYASEVLELLRSYANTSTAFMLGQIRPMLRTRFGSRVHCTSICDLHLSINGAVPIVAAEVTELIDYLALSGPESRRLRIRASQLIAAPSNWQLEALSGAENEVEQFAAANTVRLAALTGFFESAVPALEALYQRVERKLSPPQVRDRVRVDLKRCIVTVDNVPYSVSENQALMFHVLVKTNGGPLSGPDMGRLVEFKGEFKASRYRDKIEYAELKKLIPKPAKPDFKFRLVLPPLPE